MLGELKFKSETDKIAFIDLMKRNGIEFVDSEKKSSDSESSNKNLNKLINREISNLFDKLCILPHMKGYGYLVEAVTYIYLENRNLYVTKEVYPHVANKFNTKATRVERAMRHAIEVSFNRLDPDSIYEYYGNCYNNYKGTLTVSEFLYICVNKLKIALEDKGVTHNE